MQREKKHQKQNQKIIKKKKKKAIDPVEKIFGKDNTHIMTNIPKVFFKIS